MIAVSPSAGSSQRTTCSYPSTSISMNATTHTISRRSMAWCGRSRRRRRCYVRHPKEQRTVAGGSSVTLDLEGGRSRDDDGDIGIRAGCVRRRLSHGGSDGPRLGDTAPEATGDAGEGLRHLARVHVGRHLADGARRRPRSAGPRRRARRSGVDPLRGPARVGHPRPRHRRRAGASPSVSTRPTPSPRSSTCSAIAHPWCTSPRTKSRSTRWSPSAHSPRRRCARSSTSNPAACVSTTTPA